jgi:undecaprenyl-diphosphatase
MTVIEAILLGIVQGVTEFLPVSSSGHLTVARNLMGLDEIPMLFDVMMHLPTLLAVVIVFRKRIGALFASLFRFLTRSTREDDGVNLRLIVIIIIASLTTAVIGLGIERLQKSFSVSIKLVGVFFLVTAAVLIVSRFFNGSRGYGSRGYESLRLKDALLTGAAQGLAVLPGISRSGMTIAASLACGIERKKAGEYAFILSIPAILGALTLEIKDLDLLPVDPYFLTAGMISSFVVGLLSLLLLLRIIRKGRLYLFSIYLIPVGLATILFL